ncbi:hypothetical protein ACS0PU_013067 [Formica fusca]
MRFAYFYEDLGERSEQCSKSHGSNSSLIAAANSTWAGNLLPSVRSSPLLYSRAVLCVPAINMSTGRCKSSTLPRGAGEEMTEGCVEESDKSCRTSSLCTPPTALRPMLITRTDERARGVPRQRASSRSRLVLSAVVGYLYAA